MTAPKILTHPDLQEIISKLTSGDTVREVSAWLKKKYPKDKEKQISHNALNEFRNNHLNIHGAVIQDIRNQTQEMINKEKEEEVEDSLVVEVKKNKTYQEKLSEVIDHQIDWRFKLLQLLNIIEARFEQLFNMSQNNPNNYKPDYVMINWMNMILDIIREIRKVEGAPDQVVQHNITIQTIEEQSALLQEALKQTLAEIDLETSLLLMDKISENLSKLKATKEISSNSVKDYEKISNSIVKVTEKIVK